MLMPETPPHMLTEEEIDRFWTDGVILVRGLYSQKWIDTVREGLNEICNLDDIRIFFQRSFSNLMNASKDGLSP